MFKRLLILLTIVLNVHNSAIASESEDSEKGPWDFALPLTTDFVDFAGESLSKRAKYHESEESQPSFEEPQWEYFHPNIVDITGSMNISLPLEPIDKVAASAVAHNTDDVSGSFQHIFRHSINAICLFFNGHPYLNKFILSMLSPHEVKSVMGTCRVGYWLGRTRGYVKVANISEEQEKLKAFSAFIGVMISDKDYPLRALDLTYLNQPERIFSFLGPEQVKQLQQQLISYTWNNGHEYRTISSSSVTAQLSVLLGCSHLKALNFHAITNEVQAGHQLAPHVPDPTIARLVKSFQTLEVLRFCYSPYHSGRSSFRQIDLNTILRGFKHLKVLDAVAAVLFSHFIDPSFDQFKIIADNKNPRSPLLSLPLLEEIHIQHELNENKFRSLLQLSPNLKKISLRKNLRNVGLPIVRDLFVQSNTLMEYEEKEWNAGFSLSRKEYGAELELKVNFGMYQRPIEKFQRINEIIKTFAGEHGPGIVVREVRLEPINLLRPEMSLEDVRSCFSQDISNVQILRLPGLQGFSATNFISLLGNLSKLNELDFSQHGTALMPDAAYVHAAGKVKHMNISYMERMTPKLIEKILAVRHLDTLTLSLITQREGEQLKEFITQEMVQTWREKYPETQIYIPLEKRVLIVDVKPKKPRKKKKN